MKNGAVFEIDYVGALGGGWRSVDSVDEIGVDGAGGSSKGGREEEDSRRNWWAAARELVRVTKGKGVVVSGGGPVVDAEQYLRAPRDVGNL